MTSELRTKNGLSSFPRISSASLRGPAVPRGSDSMEKVILTLNLSSYCFLTSALELLHHIDDSVLYLCQILFHNLRTIVNS
jgi:hypothetical protein